MITLEQMMKILQKITMTSFLLIASLHASLTLANTNCSWNAHATQGGQLGTITSLSPSVAKNKKPWVTKYYISSTGRTLCAVYKNIAASAAGPYAIVLFCKDSAQKSGICGLSVKGKIYTDSHGLSWYAYGNGTWQGSQGSSEPSESDCSNFAASWQVTNC